MDYLPFLVRRRKRQSNAHQNAVLSPTRDDAIDGLPLDLFRSYWHRRCTHRAHRLTCALWLIAGRLPECVEPPSITCRFGYRTRTPLDQGVSPDGRCRRAIVPPTGFLVPAHPESSRGREDRSALVPSEPIDPARTPQLFEIRLPLFDHTTRRIPDFRIGNRTDFKPLESAEKQWRVPVALGDRRRNVLVECPEGITPQPPKRAMTRRWARTSSPACWSGNSVQNEQPPHRRSFSTSYRTQPPTHATL